MDRETRGQLLVEKEETEQALSRIMEAIKTKGRILVDFGDRLVKSPEKVVFSNAPEPLGSVPIELLYGPAIDWNSIPEKAGIASEIQELRRLQKNLSNIVNRLNN